MFAANTTGVNINLAVGGLTQEIALPDVQNLDGFTTGDNINFVVPETGRYFLSYTINVSAVVNVGALEFRILVNGTPAPGTIIDLVLLGVGGYTNNTILNLNQNDVITLQAANVGILGVTATLLGAGSTGASLTVIRLE
jgi:hypothetical protein